MQNNQQKIALVTGANKGIGFETVRQLALQGIKTYLTGRNRDQVFQSTKTLQKEGLDVVPLVVDITNDESVSLAAETLAQRHGYLDILVNNAGVRIEKYGKNPSQQPIAEWQATFETNLLGTVRVTQALLPLVRNSPAGRVVNLSSLLGSIGLHSDPNSYTYSDMFKSLPAYSASKSAINSWTVHLAYELRDTEIRVNAVHPGYSKTDMNDGDGDLEPIDGAYSSIQMAILASDGPHGTYTHMGKHLPW